MEERFVDVVAPPVAYRKPAERASQASVRSTTHRCLPNRRAYHLPTSRFCQALSARSPPTTLLVPTDDLDLLQHDPPLRRTDPASCQLRVLPLHLRPHEVAIEFLGSYPRRAGPAERVEDEGAFPGRSQDGSAEEAQ